MTNENYEKCLNRWSFGFEFRRENRYLDKLKDKYTKRNRHIRRILGYIYIYIIYIYRYNIYLYIYIYIL